MSPKDLRTSHTFCASSLGSDSFCPRERWLVNQRKENALILPETEPNSSLANLLADCVSLAPNHRALALEASKELKSAHAKTAMQEDSTVPDNAEDEVDFHYVCFVKSHKNGHLYQMDGDRKGPIDRGLLLGPEEDILAEGGLSVIREFIRREKGGNPQFSLLALVGC